MNKILIVDDSRTDRILAQKILTSHNYQVIEADNPAQVSELVLRENPDLILLDIIMPGTNGYEVCRHLKRTARTRSIPVVFLSGKKQPSDIYWGKLQGADDYLPKPFNPDRLLELVEKILKKTQDTGLHE